MKMRLREVADIQVGYHARSRIEEEKEGSHWLIQSRDFDSFHTLNVSGLMRFYPERKPEPYLVRRGDVLFQARGAEHFAYCVEEEWKETLVANGFYILRIRSQELLPQYLAWFLNQPKAQAYFRSQGHKTGISFVSKEVLSRLSIQIPSLEIQKRIGEITVLLKHEQVLLKKLSSLRATLINAACMKAIQE